MASDPTKKDATIRVKGRVRSVTPAKQELTLSAEEIDSAIAATEHSTDATMRRGFNWRHPLFALRYRVEWGEWPWKL